MAVHGYPPPPQVRSRLMKQAADSTRTPKKTPLPLPELRRRWRADAISRFGAAMVDGLLALCRRAAAAIRTTWNAARPGSSGAAVDVDVDLAAVDVAVTVYIHHGEFRRRHLLAEARRYLARELRGRRAQPGLDDRITAAAIRAYCVDVTTPPTSGRPLRPVDHTVYTAVWHPAPPPRREVVRASKGTAVELSVYDRAVATSRRLQALLLASRTPARPAQPGRAVRSGRPSPTDQPAAIVLCEQLVFTNDTVVQEDQDDDQEQEFAISAERLAWLEKLHSHVGDLARETPEAKKSGGGTTATPPHRPAYQPRR